MKLGLRDTHGGALVEVALASPIMVLMMLGAFEIGRVAHHAVEVSNAARAGASYGGLNLSHAPGSNGTNTATVIQAAKNDAPDLANLTANATTACVCETIDTSTNTVTYNPASGTLSCTNPIITGCNVESGTSSQKAITYVSVTSQADINAVFKVGSLPSSYSTHGFSFMRVLPN